MSSHDMVDDILVAAPASRTPADAAGADLPASTAALSNIARAADPRGLARTAAARLMGTAKSLHDLGDEFESAETDAAFCAELDAHVFCCERCGWWCDLDESSDGEDDFICLDCAA